LLWIKGKPGAGKSTLMAFIYKSFQENVLLKQTVVLEYFFHGRGTELQHTRLGMFRSLMHQLFISVPLIRPSIFAVFEEKCGLFGEAGKGWEWRSQELEELFEIALLSAAQSKRVIIFVDALDEAGYETGNELAEYFHELNGKIETRGCHARICISCRHYPVIFESASFDIRVEDENHNDIATYINDKLDIRVSRVEVSTISTEQCKELGNTIAKRSLGVFQWVRLVVARIILLHQKGNSLAEIYDELNKVPQALHGVYEYILQTVIEQEDLANTLHLIQWVCFAKRPLIVAELRHAMASDDGCIEKAREFCDNARRLVATDTNMKRLINSWSGGLVEVQHHKATSRSGLTIGGARVQFIHQSVDDFFRSSGLNRLLSLYSASDGFQSHTDSAGSMTVDVAGRSHDRLRKSCINHILLNETQIELYTKSSSRDSRVGSNEAKETFPIEKSPFTSYALMFWLWHSKLAESEGVTQEDILQRLEYPTVPMFRHQIRIYNIFLRYLEENPEIHSTLLHVAAEYNLGSVVQAFIKKSWNLEESDGFDSTALFKAASAGHTDIIKMLLGAGANVEAENQFLNKALRVAAEKGHEEIVQLLLRGGAKMDATVIYHALEGGANIIAILLRKGADINCRGNHFNSPLQAAAFKGDSESVSLLLENGANIDAQGGRYCTALQTASYRSKPKIVELLLEAGASVAIQGGEFGCALHAALTGGNPQIVQSLLQYGAEISTQHKIGHELQSALNEGAAATVTWLCTNYAKYGMCSATVLPEVTERFENIATQLLEQRRGVCQMEIGCLPFVSSSCIYSSRLPTS
jgi:ankyrin repeat protein/5S rRNA maturation endonuclease (ribonuclease M5)